MSKVFALFLIILCFGCHSSKQNDFDDTVPFKRNDIHENVEKHENTKWDLVFSCGLKQRVFTSNASASVFNLILNEVGLHSKCRSQVILKHELIPHSTPHGVDNIIVERYETIYVISYWSNGETRQEFDDLAIAEIRKFKLMELGCNVRIE